MTTFIELLQDYFRFWPYLAAGLMGVAFAVLDRKAFGRPLFAILLVLIAVGGQVFMHFNPFTFASGDRFFQGMIASTLALFALGGYLVAAAFMWMRRGVA